MPDLYSINYVDLEEPKKCPICQGKLKNDKDYKENEVYKICSNCGRMIRVTRGIKNG